MVVSPGGAYGPNGEGFFRISLTVPDERLAEAVEPAALEHGGLRRCTTAASCRSQGALQLAVLEEVRTTEPPIRLSALFFEPGSAEQVAAELRALGDVVLAVGAPLVGPRRGAPRALRRAAAARGVAPRPPNAELARLAGLLDGVAAYRAGGRGAESGPVERGRLPALPAVRDERGRRLLRSPGPPAARQAPSARACSCASTSWRATT